MNILYRSDKDYLIEIRERTRNDCESCWQRNKCHRICKPCVSFVLTDSNNVACVQMAYHLPFFGVREEVVQFFMSAISDEHGSQRRLWLIANLGIVKDEPRLERKIKRYLKGEEPK